VNSNILRRRNKYGENSVGKDRAGACEDMKCDCVCLPIREPRVLCPASATYPYKHCTFYDVNTETKLTRSMKVDSMTLLVERNFERRESMRLLIRVRNCLLLESVT
jgi:hypothetical protein